jgi:hypothetical protein
MGKLALIIVVSVVLLFGTIMLSVGNRTSELPEMISKNEAEILGAKLGSFAMGYALKNLNNHKILLEADDIVRLGYSNFAILDGSGSVDSIIYKMNSTMDTVQVISKVSFSSPSYQMNQQHSVFLNITSNATIANIDTALVTNGTIKLKAHAAVSGDILENQSVTVEDLFGMTSAALKDLAVDQYSYFENPSNHQVIGDTLTWVEGNFHPTSWWTGSGILIVNGDFRMTAHAQFDGILIVLGNFEIGAQSEVNGAVAILSTGQSTLKAHSDVVINASVVSDKFEVISNHSAVFAIISWD